MDKLIFVASNVAENILRDNEHIIDEIFKSAFCAGLSDEEAVKRGIRETIKAAVVISTSTMFRWAETEGLISINQDAQPNLQVVPGKNNQE